MAPPIPSGKDLLEADSEDLAASVKSGRARAAKFRDALVKRVVDSLHAKKSVLLLGPTGVGKSAIIHSAALQGSAWLPASRASTLDGAAVEATTRASPGGGYKTIRSLSTSTFLIGTRWLGELPTRVAALAKAAMAEKVVLHISDVMNLRTAGSSSNDPSTVMDQLTPDVAAGRLLLVCEATKEERDRLATLRGFLDLFEVIEVPPLAQEEVEQLLTAEADALGVNLVGDARNELLALPARFLASRVQPGGALELLEQVARYHKEKVAKGEPEQIDGAFVGKVFSIFSGLPRFVVVRSETRPVNEVRAWFTERVVGQREAIDAVVETISLFKAGLHDPDRAIGTFLFVGPTGVGKTELARRLAEYLFGSAQRMLRFDLSEFTDYDAPQRLIGDRRHPEQPARLIDPVRTQPFQVVLLDEIDKAHTNVWDLLLPMLDDGRLTSAFGETVDFRGTIVIATSNTGAVEASKSFGFGAQPGERGVDEDKVRRALEHTFRPELLNRFQHICIFRSLSRDELRKVARREVDRVMARDGITRNRLVVDVSDAAIDLALEHGYDPKYGARALKREVQRTLALPIALTLMEKKVEPGALLRVEVDEGELDVRVVETKASRASRKEKEPVRTATGEKLTLEALRSRQLLLEQRVDQVLQSVGGTSIKRRFEQLQAQRFEPGFWKNPTAAVIAESELDRLQMALSRTATLREEFSAVAQKLKGAPPRAQYEDLSRALSAFERKVTAVRRELLGLDAEGMRDALVMIRPVGRGGRPMRDRLFSVYREWARARGHDVDLVWEPLEDDENACFSVYGPFALGYLREDRGLHRFEDGHAPSVAEVQVTPLGLEPNEAKIIALRALKQVGHFGGPVKSRLEVEHGATRTVLQGHRTVAQAREVAGEVLASCAVAQPNDGEVVRTEGAEPTPPDALQAWLEERVDRRQSKEVKR